MRELIYLGYYDTADNADEKRSFALSAANKMDYIISAICRNGWQVQLVSASRTLGKENCPGHVRTISDGVTLKLFPSLGTGGVLRRIFRTVQAHGHLLFYLLRNTKRNEPVLVYHSLGYITPICLAKRLKGFQLILEVEEIYADVSGNAAERVREQKIFDAADAYIFSTELLNEKLNQTGKPFAVCYGTYQVEEPRDCRNDSTDGTIHSVYAGTLDPRKGGAQIAVQAAGNFPAGHHLHILGFGTEEEKKQLQNLLERPREADNVVVTYDGLRRGEEYIHFLQNCQIGLSTQSPDGVYNDTSFPSKVLSYLANGLRVVSIRIPVLECCAVSDLLYYYDENTPAAIAEVVGGIDFQAPYDSREAIRRLDQQFTQSIGGLLSENAE